MEPVYDDMIAALQTTQKSLKKFHSWKSWTETVAVSEREERITTDFGDLY